MHAVVVYGTTVYHKRRRKTLKQPRLDVMMASVACVALAQPYVRGLLRWLHVNNQLNLCVENSGNARSTPSSQI